MISRKVFISSTTKDLGQYRQEAEEVINQLNSEFRNYFRLEPITMDNTVQSGERETAAIVSQQWVSEADWVILIVGWNYGYIAPDQDFSVTELEYRQAIKGTPQRKKCFVFISGDPSTDSNKGYSHKPDREKTNLYLWASASEAMRDIKRYEHMCRFREELKQKHHAIFRDIDEFREDLSRTLSRAILEILTMIHSILEFTKLATSSIEEVQILANLKRIHDRLHNIRQFAIRRWREEVLVKWVDSSISTDAQITYYKGLNKVDRIRGNLDELARKLPQRHQKLADQLNEVTNFSFGQDGNDLLGDRAKFDRSTNLFARQVQAAFSASNRAMQECAENLRHFHSNFQHYIDPSNLSILFTEIHSRCLETKFEDLPRKHERLETVLRDHNQWQTEHDRLERADAARGSSVFDDELFYLISRKEQINALMDLAAKQADGHPQLSTWKDLVRVVRVHLDELVKTSDDTGREASYERMRKAFDDLFFEVDAETLRSIEASEQCVVEHEKDLMRLKIELER
jgi:Domain of unknown function (DUF4062)